MNYLEFEAPLDWLETLVAQTKGQQFNDLQRTILRSVWEGRKYPEIADIYGCTEGHAKDVGADLWRSLSEVLGERINKRNVRSVLERARAKARQLKHKFLPLNPPSVSSAPSSGTLPAPSSGTLPANLPANLPAHLPVASLTESPTQPLSTQAFPAELPIQFLNVLPPGPGIEVRAIARPKYRPDDRPDRSGTLHDHHVNRRAAGAHPVGKRVLRGNAEGVHPGHPRPAGHHQNRAHPEFSGDYADHRRRHCRDQARADQDLVKTKARPQPPATHH